jgi:glycosyltransferase involved in cell wall biosynthesis
MLLESPAVAEEWRISHLDTSDRRSLENLGRVDVWNVLLGIRHVAELAVRMVRERPAVVWLSLSQNTPAYLRDVLFIVFARLGGARVVGHLHGGWFQEFYRAASFPVRQVIRIGCGMLAAAWVLGEGLRSTFTGLVPPERVRVVPNGVPDPGALARRRGALESFTVLYLGQLSDLKGVDDLVEAFGALCPWDLPTRLVLAGAWLTGRDERRIRAAVAASPARARVELIGVVGSEEKARLLSEADVFALPARSHEGQPLVVLEAMAAGLPVVATARGAIPDMIEDGRTGLLVPEDEGALTGALERLRARPQLRAAMGAAGRQRWEERFTAQACFRLVARELDHVYGRPHRGRTSGDEVAA